MMIKTSLLRKPLLSFYIMTFMITWVIWLPLVIYYYRSPFNVSFSTVPISLILLALLGFFGPTFASIIMTYLEKGTVGIKELLSNWIKFRIQVKWYLFVIISQILIDFISTQIAIIIFSLEVHIDFTKWYNFIPLLLRTAFIGGAIAEETGWRGYALPRTLKYTNALYASVSIGIIWALWHLPICLIPGANFPVPLSINVFLVFIIGSSCSRVGKIRVVSSGLWFCIRELYVCSMSSSRIPSNSCDFLSILVMDPRSFFFMTPKIYP